MGVPKPVITPLPKVSGIQCAEYTLSDIQQTQAERLTIPERFLHIFLLPIPHHQLFHLGGTRTAGEAAMRGVVARHMTRPVAARSRAPAWAKASSISCVVAAGSILFSGSHYLGSTPCFCPCLFFRISLEKCSLFTDL